MGICRPSTWLWLWAWRFVTLAKCHILENVLFCTVMKLVCLLFNHLVRESDEFHIVLRNTFVQLQPHFSGTLEVGNFCLLGEVCSLILEQYFLMWCDLVMFSLHFSRQIYIFLSEHALKIAETAKLIFMFIDEYRKGTVSAYLSWYQ